MPPKSSSRGGAARPRRKRRGSNSQPGSGAATPVTPAAASAIEAEIAAGQEPVLEAGDGFMLPVEETLTPRPTTAKDLNVLVDRGSARDPERVQVCLLCKKIHETDPAVLVNDPRIWRYAGRTSTTVLREHMFCHHKADWIQLAKDRGWNDLLRKYIHGPDVASGINDDLDIPAFSAENLKRALVKFISTDDQSIRLVEVPEFRALLRMVGGLDEGDIPGRSKMRTNILQDYQRIMVAMKADLANALGKVSLTTDMWSSKNMDSYMAVTAHFVSRALDGELTLQSLLIAFYPLLGSHKAEDLGKAFLKVCKRAGIEQNIGWVTSDNASVNTAMMRHIEQGLVDIDPSFNAEERRIMCFPHVLHICVSKILEYVERGTAKSGSRSTQTDDYEDLPPPPSASNDSDSAEDIEARNPLGLLRTIIRKIRRSGKMRKAFKQLIISTNANKQWKPNPDGSIPVVPVLELLRDVRTRWDSTFLMINRARKLRLALDLFCKIYDEFTPYMLSMRDWGQLFDLAMVLLVPYGYTQKMSTDQNPSLSFTISSFERLLTDWENIHIPILPSSGLNSERMRRYAAIGVEHATRYYRKLDDTMAYVVCMILNPHVRHFWIETNWGTDYYKTATNGILEMMELYASRVEEESEDEVIDLENLSDDENPSPGAPEPAELNVFADISFSSLGHGLGIYRNIKPSSAQQQRRRSASDEWKAYKALSLSEIKDTSILEFWRASHAIRNEERFPILFRIAVDFLPIQASSVPCERAFSSCAETDTRRRNRLSPTMIEALQILKGWYRRERTLDFTTTWSSTEHELTVEAPEADNLAILTEDNSRLEANLGRAVANLVLEEGLLDADILL